jgi:glucokinase
VGFINDFEALGFSLGQAARLETTCLSGGLTGGLTKGAGANEGAPRLVMGAGTGFNAAAWCPSRFGGAPHVVAAECGHMTLALAGEEEFSLQQALSRINGRASVERALSGNGLVAIYNWVCARHGAEARFTQGAEISSRAVERSDALCGEAAQMFMHLLGRVAGDLALAYLPYDGIYLSGGVTRALGPLLESEPAFLRAFTAKGRMAELMEQFSIHLLSDDASALHGCAEWVRLSSAA